MPHATHADIDFVRDTSAEALSVFYEIQRKRLVEQKLVDIFDLSEGLFETVKADIRLRYPEADERQVFFAPWPVECRVNWQTGLPVKSGVTSEHRTIRPLFAVTSAFTGN